MRAGDDLNGRQDVGTEESARRGRAASPHRSGGVPLRPAEDAPTATGTAESAVSHGLDRIVQATGYSLSGLRLAASGEAAFRQEVVVAVVLLPLAFWVGRTWAETALLIGSVALVLIIELLNSAVEAVVDRVSLDRHELSKRAKDLASAAVFLSLVLCGGIWIAGVWQRLA